MNYKRIYDEIILRAVERLTLDGYHELHHIVPKSMGGSDDRTNTVYLTAREHYIAHWLLYKIHLNRPMAHAWHAMSALGLGGRRYTSHTFRFAKEAYIKSRSTKSPDEDLSNPIRKGSTRGRRVTATCVDTGFTITFDCARWAASCVKGDQSSITKCCAGRSVMHKGYSWAYEDAAPQSAYNKSRIKRIGDEVRIFDNLTDAVLNTEGASKPHITSCCKGNRPSHAGFRWEYYSG